MLTQFGEINESLIEARFSSGSHDGNRWERIDYFYEGKPILVDDGRGGFHQTKLDIFPKPLSVFGKQQGIHL